MDEGSVGQEEGAAEVAVELVAAPGSTDPALIEQTIRSKLVQDHFHPMAFDVRVLPAAAGHVIGGGLPGSNLVKSECAQDDETHESR